MSGGRGDFFSPPFLEVNVLGRRMIFDFWAYDAATEVAKETLEELGIPFEVETERRVRDPSAPEDLGRYDDWARIYVDTEVLVKWLERKIDERIRNC